MDTIRYNCNFDFCFNNTEITATVLDGGDEIILANWPNDKHIICNTKLTMYFTINLAFTNYLDMFPNLTNSLTLIRDKTSYEQPLPIHQNVPHYDSSLNNRPTKLKDFLNNYINTNGN